MYRNLRTRFEEPSASSASRSSPLRLPLSPWLSAKCGSRATSVFLAVSDLKCHFLSHLFFFVSPVSVVWRLLIPLLLHSFSLPLLFSVSMSAKFFALGLFTGALSAYGLHDSLQLSRDRVGFYYRSIAGGNRTFTPHAVVYERHFSLPRILSPSGWDDLLLSVYSSAIRNLGYRF